MAAAGSAEIAALRPRLVRYLARLVGAQDAEDLAQTALLKATEALADFRGDARFSTWVYRIATNAALERLRKPHCIEDAALEALAPSAEATATRAQMNSCIRGYVEQLPASYRAVVVLSELEGFTNQEIARILGISLESVKIRLHRGRAKLRAALGAGCTLSRDGTDELACERKS